MKRFLIVWVRVVVLILVPTLAFAQQQLISDPEIYEKDHFRSECKMAQFEPDFIKRFDINNDGIIDLVSDHSKLVCDGKRGPGCNSDGCPYNFYLQAREGGYFMIATAQIYSYDFVKYFGNMVFLLNMHPRFCDRTDAVPCEMRVRVRGGRFVTISKK
ncbi:hypothetical protein J2046_001410 [Rhizobium petrolearium]|uniref:hypothetical protein n=1 Tax=Neorhizobium petrolearium TaxID=515361 RepID=UPI001AE5B2CE|nr:hypothetical protein [Neorhizobium petrolearium]MBP1843156.1 hypothetical protein [Neorhizobium petrolearium]